MCFQGGAIIFHWKDAFFSGFIGKLMYEEIFNSKSIDFDNISFWTKAKIKCPKCLIISEIGNLTK